MATVGGDAKPAASRVAIALVSVCEELIARNMVEPMHKTTIPATAKQPNTNMPTIAHGARFGLCAIFSPGKQKPVTGFPATGFTVT
jgi:hypothetical protein